MRGETEPGDRSDHTVLRHVTCSVPGTLQILIAGWTSYTWGSYASINIFFLIACLYNTFTLAR